jgi:hypothetical protein
MGTPRQWVPSPFLVRLLPRHCDADRFAEQICAANPSLRRTTRSGFTPNSLATSADGRILAATLLEAAMSDQQFLTNSLSLSAPRRRGGVKWPASKWWCLAPFAVAIALLGACAGSLHQSQIDTQNNLQRFREAARDAVQCRATAARDPRYQILNQHMPLANIDDANLSQMIDERFATNSEIAVLASWIRDVNGCLERLLRETNATISAFGPIIEASWNNDIAVFVKLAHRQMNWGEAVMRLKSNTTKLRADVIARADQVSAELSKMEQAEFNRRTAIITSVIGILP